MTMNDYKGEMTQFESGAIRDTQDGKLDFIETIGWISLGEFAKYMTAKKNKYGAGNFKKGIPVESYEQSLIRHWHKYMAIKECLARGVPVPPELEPQEDHISAIIFNAFGILFERAIYYIKTKLGVDPIERSQEMSPPPVLK